MGSVNQLYGSSSFLSAREIVGRPPIRCRIIDVREESFNEDGSKAKVTLTLAGCRKRLVLGRTNAEGLAAAFGDDWEQWPGREILVSTHRVLFRGQTTDGLLVQPASAPRQVEAAVLPRPSPSRPRPAPAPAAPLEEEPFHPDLGGGPSALEDEPSPF